MNPPKAFTEIVKIQNEMYEMNEAAIKALQREQARLDGKANRMKCIRLCRAEEFDPRLAEAVEKARIEMGFAVFVTNLLVRIQQRIAEDQNAAADERDAFKAHLAAAHSKIDALQKRAETAEKKLAEIKAAASGRPPLRVEDFKTKRGLK